MLYIHNVLHRTARVEPGDWDALAPLCALRFLSISGNRLAALPHSVQAMSQLQARGGGAVLCL